LGGMNEAGLVVEIMSLAESKYPSPDSRPYIRKSQWRQYQLDNFSTVQEVIESHSQIRVVQGTNGPASHYLVGDKMGNCASIEFINGKPMFHTGETMPVKVLTNSTYAESVSYWQQGRPPLHKGVDPEDSLYRFASAADMVSKFDPKTSGSAIDYAFDILKIVAPAHGTMWSIVYDINNFQIFWRTYRNQKIRHLNLKKFDFSCRLPVMVLDINADLSGDVTGKFMNYTQEINRKLIGNSTGKTNFLNHLTQDTLDRMSKYPDTMICQEESDRPETEPNG